MSKKNQIRVGLDIDGVICCFVQGVLDRAKTLGLQEHFPETPEGSSYWGLSDKFSEVMRDAWLDADFWLNLPPTGLKVNFTPVVYITSRPIKTEVTEQWLAKNNFPKAQVITVKQPSEKIEHLLNINPDIYVDDLYSTIQECRDNGINAVLMKAAYQVGHKEECKGLPVVNDLSLEELEKWV